MQSEIVVLLDRSGSMQSAKSDHEGGLNSFVQDQKELGGDVRFTLIQFDDKNPCDVQFDGVPISDVGKCHLVPRGGTPLLDGVGMGVAHVKDRLHREGRKPDDVMVMVITDGYENSSREFTKERIKSLVTEQEKAGWKFLYLGANVDAFGEAAAIGVQGATAINFANNPQGVRSLYRSTSSNRKQAFAMASAGASADVVGASYSYSPEQRAEAMGVDEADGDLTCWDNTTPGASTVSRPGTLKGRK